jgi:hypothetical protein
MALAKRNGAILSQIAGQKRGKKLEAIAKFQL